MTTKEMKAISFDGGSTIYNVVDAQALHSSDVISTYSPSGTSPINGKGVANALEDYQLIAPLINVLATSGTITLQDNSINSIVPTGAVTFTLPTVTDNSEFHQILVQVKLNTVQAIVLGTSYFANLKVPDMSIVGEYDLVYEYDKAGGHWVVGCISKGTAS